MYGAFSRREYIGLKAQEIRSFVYVQDVVDVILRLIDVYSSATIGGNSSSAGVVSGVYNVGGPLALSRLDVARSLCSVLGSEMHVTSRPSVPLVMVQPVSVQDSKVPWEVYVMDAPVSSTSTTSDTAGASSGARTSNTTVVHSTTSGTVPVAVHGELRSPRDISMDSAATESVVGVKFTSIENILLDSLHVN